MTVKIVTYSYGKAIKALLWRENKEKIVEDYFQNSVTMKELSELYGIFGSNTVADWVKKYGHLNSKKSVPIMNENTQNEEAKIGRKKRQRNYEQHQISSLECDLDKERRNSFFEIFNKLENCAGRIDFFFKKPS